MLPPIEYFRNRDLNPQEVSSFVYYLKKQNLDFDVYLPSLKRNLQRELVWTLEQKQEIVMSLIVGRHIPHCSFINIIDPSGKPEDIWQVIDGKQRLTSIFAFIDGEFHITINGKDYFYDDLTQEYKLSIYKANIRYYTVFEDYKKPISDLVKINWFKFINFAGTAQEKEHMDSLKQQLP